MKSILNKSERCGKIPTPTHSVHIFVLCLGPELAERGSEPSSFFNDADDTKYVLKQDSAKELE